MVFFILYLLLLLLSVFTASWRISLISLGLQACGIGIYFVSTTNLHFSHSVMVLIELVVIKGLASPLFFLNRFKRSDIPRFIDLIPANLVHWVCASFLVIFALKAATYFCTHSDTRHILQVGCAFSAVALGLFVLSSQDKIAGQIIGLLTIENGVTLFSVYAFEQNPPFIVELGIILDFIVLIVIAGNFLQKLNTHYKQEIVAKSEALVPEEESVVQETIITVRPEYGDIL